MIALVIGNKTLNNSDLYSGTLVHVRTLHPSFCVKLSSSSQQFTFPVHSELLERYVCSELPLQGCLIPKGVLTRRNSMLERQLDDFRR